MKKYILSFLLFISVSLCFAEGVQDRLKFPFGTKASTVSYEMLSDEDYSFYKKTPDSILYVSKEEFYFTNYYKFIFNENHELIAELRMYQPTERLPNELYKEFFITLYNSYNSFLNLKLKDFIYKSDMFVLDFSDEDTNDCLLSLSIGDFNTSPGILRLIYSANYFE